MYAFTEASKTKPIKANLRNAQNERKLSINKGL